MLLVWSRATAKPAGVGSSWCPASHDPHSGEGGTVGGSEPKPGGHQDAVINNVKGKPYFRKHDEGTCSQVAPPLPRCRIGMGATRSSRASPCAPQPRAPQSPSAWFQPKCSGRISALPKPCSVENIKPYRSLDIQEEINAFISING